MSFVRVMISNIFWCSLRSLWIVYTESRAGKAASRRSVLPWAHIARGTGLMSVRLSWSIWKRPILYSDTSANEWAS
jgi:hypothetical protein